MQSCAGLSITVQGDTQELPLAGFPSQSTHASRVPGDTQTADAVCLLLKALQQHHRSHSTGTKQLSSKVCTWVQKEDGRFDRRASRRGGNDAQIFADPFSYPFRDQKRARSKQWESRNPDKPIDWPGTKMGATSHSSASPLLVAASRPHHRSLHLLQENPSREFLLSLLLSRFPAQERQCATQLQVPFFPREPRGSVRGSGRRRAGPGLSGAPRPCSLGTERRGRGGPARARPAGYSLVIERVLLAELPQVLLLLLAQAAQQLPPGSPLAHRGPARSTWVPGALRCRTAGRCPQPGTAR